MCPNFASEFGVNNISCLGLSHRHGEGCEGFMHNFVNACTHNFPNFPKSTFLFFFSKTRVGLLAYHSMAVLSTCQNPKNFAGVNIQQLIEQRLTAQFYYKGNHQQQVTIFRLHN